VSKEKLYKAWNYKILIDRNWTIIVTCCDLKELLLFENVLNHLN